MLATTSQLFYLKLSAFLSGSALCCARFMSLHAQTDDDRDRDIDDHLCEDAMDDGEGLWKIQR
jgi:hypothetical protein